MKTRRLFLRPVLLSLSLSLLISGQAFAQLNISGQVSSSSGEPVPDSEEYPQNPAYE